MITSNQRARSEPAARRLICRRSATSAGGVFRRFLVASAAVAALLLALPAAARAQDWPPAPPLKAVAEQDRGGPLPPSVSAEPNETGGWECEFVYKPADGAKSVHLAGSFNGWNPSATAMTGPDANGVWRARLTLPGGQHEYKFVLDGDQWLHDPQNPDRAPDGYTGYNSILRLGRLASLTRSNARVGDGQIDTAGLEHINNRPLYFQWLSREQALVRYRTLAHDVEKVEVSIDGGAITPMSPVQQDERFKYYEARVDLPAGGAASRLGNVTYTFVLTDGELRGSHPRIFVNSYSENLVIKTPEWARDAVWYQIMLDRFRNGDPGNDPDPVHPWTSDWFEPAEWEARGGETFYRWYVFRRLYGGDIAGLEEKLPYLKQLGVNALYLNPIFKADTHHKYNAASYLHVDDHFGTKGDYEKAVQSEDLLDPRTWTWTETDKRFLAFLKKAKSMGIRVILDGVFNHVGVAHPAFQDVVKNGRDSRFADWFDVVSWEPFEYRGWAGVRDLPAFKKSNTGLASASLTRHIYDVTRRWMDPDGDGDPRDGIDGWRLDVPNELPIQFWADWRQHVKSINPDAYIVGEIWDPADQWLDGKHFDAVMNYPFARTAVAWIINRDKLKITPTQADAQLAALRLSYPAAATYVLQNLVDSHDTDRVASMAANPDRAYDKMNRVQDDNPDYDNSRPDEAAYRRVRLIALLQATYVGAPMIYYGDEAGMWGADDPTCRKPMLWEDLQPYARPEENFVMKDHLAYYRQVIALRNEHAALRRGSFETLVTDDAADVWAFLRAGEREQLIVVLNASNEQRSVDVPVSTAAAEWKVVCGGSPNAEGGSQVVKAAGGRVRVEVPAIGGTVLHASR